MLDLLHELLPSVRIVALLVNPTDPANAEENDFDGVFKKLTEMRAGALIIGGDALFTSYGEQLGALAIRHGVPAFYKGREFATAGGLIAYGSDIADSYRVAGNYTGRRAKNLPICRFSVQQKSS